MRPAEQKKGDVDADDQKGEKFDDRLGRDREHHAALVLRGVGVPRSEQDRENRHRDRDEESEIAEQRDVELGRRVVAE